MSQWETFTATPVGVLTLIDRFAQWRGTRGALPGPIPPLRFTLLERREAAGFVRLEPSLLLSPVPGASGAYLFPDEAHLDGAALYRITPGQYRLRIAGDFYQTREVDVPWPPAPGDPGPIELNPGVAYPFPDLTLPSTALTLLRGALLREASGAPLAGVLVELIEPPNQGPFASTITDATGGWVLVLPGGRTGSMLGTLRFTPPDGGLVFTIPEVKIEKGRDNSVSQPAARGVVRSADGMPIADAEITVSIQAGSARSGRDGSWTFYFKLQQPEVPARITATAPNGRSAFQDVIIRQRATVVVPVIQIAVN